MSEQNRAVVRRIYEELFNRGAMAAADELCTPDVLLHSPTLSEPGRGPEAIRQFAGELRTGFPDLHIAIEDLIAEGDKVVTRWRSTRQTHTGPYQGLPPTGRRVRMTGIGIYRVVDGKVEEIWLEIDALGGVQQMGVVPPYGISAFGRVRFILGSLLRFAFLEMRHSIRTARGKRKTARARGHAPRT